MELSIRRVSPEEAPGIISFYFGLIDEMKNNEYAYNPRWHKEVYPSTDYLVSAVKSGEVYIAESQDETVAAMVLNHTYNEGYDEAKWNISASCEEVAVIHTLGVKQSQMKSGIGSFMMEQAIKIAKKNGYKAIRLDALSTNLPAKKLYEKFGFKFISDVGVYYEKIGDCIFELYELVL